jgi:hypothetical protein
MRGRLGDAGLDEQLLGGLHRAGRQANCHLGQRGGELLEPLDGRLFFRLLAASQFGVLAGSGQRSQDAGRQAARCRAGSVP